MAVAVSFHGDVINCGLARRGMRRGLAEANGSGGVQRVWFAAVGPAGSRYRSIAARPVALSSKCKHSHVVS